MKKINVFAFFLALAAFLSLAGFAAVAQAANNRAEEPAIPLPAPPPPPSGGPAVTPDLPVPAPGAPGLKAALGLGEGGKDYTARVVRAAGGEKLEGFKKEIDPKALAAYNSLGFDILSEIRKSDPKASVFISGFSIMQALSMTYNGADGGPKKDMAKALRVEGIDDGVLNGSNMALRNLISALDPKVILNVANSLWANKNVTFEKAFMEANRKAFDAEAASLDFASPDAAKKINEWVKQKTAGKIEKVIDKTTARTMMILVNAIYFKGVWSAQFDPARTKDADFNAAGGAKGKVKMMEQNGKYLYQENEKFQAVSLPYGDGNLSMLVFLPAKNSSLDDFMKEAGAESYAGWAGSFAERPGVYRMPRFKMEYSVTLNPVLSALGMASSFSPATADFTRMCKGVRDICITLVMHKTFVEVNEEGTEAAAVTAVMAETKSFREPEKPFEMTVDRPFFFTIHDNVSGTILFMGAINDVK